MARQTLERRRQFCTEGVAKAALSVRRGNEHYKEHYFANGKHFFHTFFLDAPYSQNLPLRPENPLLSMVVPPEEEDLDCTIVRVCVL